MTLHRNVLPEIGLEPSEPALRRDRWGRTPPQVDQVRVIGIRALGHLARNWADELVLDVDEEMSVTNPGRAGGDDD